MSKPALHQPDDTTEPLARAFQVDLSRVPDCELLQVYVHSGDQAAITELISRYAPMVAAVCRSTVADHQAAEDAFQVTFSVLLQSAHKIRSSTSVGAWLHGVAYRSACRVRKKMTRDGQQPSRSDINQNEPFDTGCDPVHLLARQIELETLSEEVQHLPDRLRTVVVEHYLLGKSAPSISAALDVAVTTIEGRLRRGRQVLRRRLAARGVSMSVLVAGSNYMQRAVAGCDATRLTDSFIRSFVVANSGEPSDLRHREIERLNKSEISEITSLVSEEFTMLTSMTTWKVACAAGIGCVVGGTAIGWAAIAGIGQADAGGDAAQPVSSLIADVSTENELAPFLAQTAPGSTETVDVQDMFATKVPQEWERPSGEGATVPHWAQPSERSVQVFYAKASKALDQQVDASFPGQQPLTAVATVLADAVNLPIWINATELNAFGVDPDVPINLDLPHQVSLRSALRMMLKPMELTYIVRNEVLEITSIDDADSDPLTRQYDLAYLLASAANVDALQSALTQSLVPDSWVVNGGSSNISQVGSLMIVSAPHTTHEKIEEFLSGIASAKSNNLR